MTLSFRVFTIRIMRVSGILVMLALMVDGAQGGGAQPAVELKSSVIAGGATRGTAVGGWSIDATAGQVDASRGTAAGGVSLDGGFWPTAATTLPVSVFSDGFE
jgi:hypothetical protein